MSGGLLETGLHAAGTAHGVAEFAEARHLAHLTHGLSPAMGAAVQEGAIINGFGGKALGSWLSPLALINGVSGLYKNTVGHEGEMGGQNYLDATVGAAETVSGGVGTLGLLGAGVEGLGGLLGASSLTGAGASMMGAAAWAAPAAMVAGAGALGYGAGRLLDNGVAWGTSKLTDDGRSMQDHIMDYFLDEEGS